MSIAVQNSSLNRAAVEVVNASFREWRLEPLPSINVTFINGTLTNDTIINGKRYNGIHINGTTIVERLQSNMVGSVPLISFIYLIMSLIIIGTMAYKSVKWIIAVAVGIPKYAPVLRPGVIPERLFQQRLDEHYPPDPTNPPTHAYAETIDRNKHHESTSQDLRECRELIRAKFALDVEAYNLRDVPPAYRHVVEDKERRSAGALLDIQAKIDGWRTMRNQWSPEEWAMIEQIHTIINQQPFSRSG